MGIYLFKVNNGNNRTECEISEVNDVILVSLLLTLSRFHTHCSGVCFVDFEQVNTFTILDVFGISKFFRYRAVSEQTFKLLTHFMPLISFCTPENIRKLEVLWCFRGIYKETSSMKWVKFSRHVFLLKMKNSSNMAWYFEKTKFVIPKFSVHSSLFE